jgi:hypothetical protein
MSLRPLNVCKHLQNKSWIPVVTNFNYVQWNQIAFAEGKKNWKTAVVMKTLLSRSLYY